MKSSIVINWERARFDFVKNGKAILLCALIFLVEMTFFFVHSALWIAPIHILVLGLILFLVYRTYKSKEGLLAPILLFLSVFSLGPFGAGGFLLFAFLYPLFSSFSLAPSEWFRLLFPQKSPTSIEIVYQRVSEKWDDYSRFAEHSSFQDIMTRGTTSQKQAVLDLIAADYNPIYAPVLRQALLDSENSVRVQASAIIVKIESDFERDLILLQARRVQNPQDPHVILEVAQNYDAFANLGVLNPWSEKQAQQEAVQAYKDYLHFEPKDKAAILSVCRLLFHAGNFEEFLSFFEQHKSDFSEIPELLHSWVLEALYRTHRSMELADALRETP